MKNIFIKSITALLLLGYFSSAAAQEIVELKMPRLRMQCLRNAGGMCPGTFHGKHTNAPDARGSLGSGRLTVTTVTVDADHEDVVAGRLQLASGEVVELFPAESLPER